MVSIGRASLGLGNCRRSCLSPSSTVALMSVNWRDDLPQRWHSMHDESFFFLGNAE